VIYPKDRATQHFNNHLTSWKEDAEILQLLDADAEILADKR